MYQVANFMGDHVIDNAVGCQHDQPIVLNHACRRAMAPFCLGFPELDLADLTVDSQISCQPPRPGYDVFTGFIDKVVLNLYPGFGRSELMPLNDEAVAINQDALFASLFKLDSKLPGPVEYLASFLDSKSFLIVQRFLLQTVLNPVLVAVYEFLHFGSGCPLRASNQHFLMGNVERQRLTLASQHFAAKRWW